MCTITNIRYVNENRRWIGYKITMSDNNKNIVCKIDNSQQCCEHFGVSTNQDFSNFIGAEFLSIFIGDVETDDDNNEMRTVSLNILTS